jgi:hypothetical protein
MCGGPGRVALGAAVSPEKTFFELDGMIKLQSHKARRPAASPRSRAGRSSAQFRAPLIPADTHKKTVPSAAA